MTTFFILLSIYAVVIGLSVLVLIIIYNKLSKPISLQDVTVTECEKFYKKGFIIRLEDGKVKWFEKEYE